MSELKEAFDLVDKSLSDACQLALKQLIPGKQVVLMTGASFRSAGYALMIEEYPDQKIHSKRKTYAPVAFASKNIPPHSLKNIFTQKNKRTFDNLYGISRVCTHPVWSNKANN